MDKVEEFQRVLGVKFNNINNLENALTHSSYANERNCDSNERLEFLGDSVLSLCMSTNLFGSWNKSEGEMTKIRASYVCEEALVLYASKISLNKYILLGNGEELTGGRNRQAILADAFEAVLGSVYLDLGFDSVNELFKKIVLPYINEIEVADHKSQLQELAQADKRTISYEIVKEYGLPHDKTFEAIVKLEGNITLGKGKGKTKKEAEQNAALVALSKMAK